MFQKNGAYIVAEIGGNFTDYETAKRLIDDAKEAGVDAVKLQTYRAETVASRKAIYDMENTGVMSQSEYFKKYEIDEETHKRIYYYAKEKKLDIFSTPSHISDVEMLEKIGTDVYKIGADDATNIPFLKKIAKIGKPIMISTGMCTMQEVREAIETIVQEGNCNITIMQVVSLYPTAAQYVNLEVIRTLMKEFPKYTIGYSDHTLGIDACIYAAVMGAKVIEKHFTYDKLADGPDHMHSATKKEMKELVDKIRLFEVMRGNGVKYPVSDEVKNRINNRKSVVAVKCIEKGEILSDQNIDVKRPGYGIPPKNMPMLLGKKAACDIEIDAVLQWRDVE